MRIAKWLVVLVLISPVSVAGQTLEDINWMTEQYPPYNYIDRNSGVITGISVDVLMEMFKRAGIKKERSDLKIFPWARSYSYLKKHPRSALFSMTYTTERLAEFKFVGPIIPTKISVITRVEKNIIVNYTSDINGLVIGVVRNDIGDQLIQLIGIDKGSVVRTSSGESLIELLQRGRVDAIAYAEDVANYLFDQAEMDASQYESVFTLQKSYIGYAFNESIESDTLEPLRKALDELRIDGTIDNIYSKYMDHDLSY